MPDHPNNTILQTLIADDEPVARLGMERLVRQTFFLSLAGTARHAADIRDVIAHSPIDLLLLDIQMPGITGIELFRSLQNPPLVIFTTAWPDYALEGFELDAVDYLLKPVTADRFAKAAAKARELFALRHPPKPFLFVKENREQKKIYLDDILYIEGMLNYIIIHTERRKFITYTSMKNILNSLPPTQFLQIHRSYIISLSRATNIAAKEVTVGPYRLPVSRLYKSAVAEWVKGKRP